jgi:CBS domain-containing membrane protein
MKRTLKKGWRLAKVVIYKETLVNHREHFWTFLGSFFGIGIIGLVNSVHYTTNDNLFLIGSFGASSVLIYGIINSPLAQPRNLIGGHVICALVGVTIHKLLPGQLWLSAAISVSLSIVLMQITKNAASAGGRNCTNSQYWFAKNTGAGLYVCVNTGAFGRVNIVISSHNI